MEIILNDLSFRGLAENVYAARDRMLRLVQTMRACILCGLSSVVRTDTDLNLLEIAEGYNVARWRNDNQVDREVRRYFSSLSAKAPLLDPQFTAEILDRMTISEFRCNGEEARGLGLALMLGTLAVSIHSGQEWDANEIIIRVYVLDENGGIDEQEAAVRHACCPEHAESHRPWISMRHRASVIDGDDLWARRDNMFPHLAFGPDIEVPIRSLQTNNPVFRSLVNALFDLEAYFCTWSTGPFMPDRLGRLATPESEATLNKYQQERTFRCHDGISRLFTWHVRLTPGGWRLYFFPENAGRRCLIGYVGVHRQTARFR